MNESIIIGTLLGDAYIQKFKDRANSYSFRYQQSNKDFALWKAEKLGLSFTYHQYDYYDKRTKKIYHSHLIHTIMDKKTKKYYYELFYTPIKEISLEILEKVDDLGLAIWFMDDGNTYYNSNNCHITLSVNGFNLESKNLIISWFKNKYNLNFKHSGKAIRLTSRKECEKFMNIVERYIPPCMEYKILSNNIKKYFNNLPDERRKYINKKNR